jgi:hypothetical protein
LEQYKLDLPSDADILTFVLSDEMRAEMPSQPQVPTRLTTRRLARRSGRCSSRTGARSGNPFVGFCRPAQTLVTFLIAFAGPP